MADVTILAELNEALHCAMKTGSWVVVVCPNQRVAEVALQTLATITPADATDSGRTLLLRGGGRVSVVAASAPVFVPGSQPFILTLAGWCGSVPGGWAKWAERATGFLAAGGHHYFL